MTAVMTPVLKVKLSTIQSKATSLILPRLELVYVDRPDIIAKYTCGIVDDRSLHPMWLSNGNLIEKGDLEVKIFCVWLLL
ncbi:putative cytosol alanyl aminopeptidase [Helianthus anomalus]